MVFSLAVYMLISLKITCCFHFLNVCVIRFSHQLDFIVFQYSYYCIFISFTMALICRFIDIFVLNIFISLLIPDVGVYFPWSAGWRGYLHLHYCCVKCEKDKYPVYDLYKTKLNQEKHKINQGQCETCYLIQSIPVFCMLLQHLFFSSWANLHSNTSLFDETYMWQQPTMPKSIQTSQRCFYTAFRLSIIRLQQRCEADNAIYQEW